MVVMVMVMMMMMIMMLTYKPHEVVGV